MRNTISKALASLESTILKETAGADQGASNAEMPVEHICEGLEKLIPPVANDNSKKGAAAKTKRTRARYRRPTDKALMSMLSEKWISATNLRKALSRGREKPSIGVIYSWYRALAKTHPKLIETTDAPERWRLSNGGQNQALTQERSSNADGLLPLESDEEKIAKSAPESPLPKASPLGAPSNTNVALQPQQKATYEGQNFKLFKGDCLDVMKSMPSRSFDMIFTSPPYNLGRDGNDRIVKLKANTNWRNCALANGYASYHDALPREEYVEWQKQILTECWRLLDDDGAVFFQHKPRIQNKELQTPIELNPGLPLRQIVIWNRKGGNNANSAFYLPVHEWIMIFVKPDFKLIKGGCAAKDVWTVNPERGNPHPAPFPVELPLKAIQSTKSQRVLDPFCGSASTGVAALQCGREFVGIELDAGYLRKSNSRLLSTEGKISSDTNL